MKNNLSILFVVSKDRNPSNGLQTMKLKHLVTFFLHIEAIAHQGLCFGTFWCEKFDLNMTSQL